MIVEQRTYLYHPGKLPEFFAIYTDGPLQLQRRILGNLVGYFTTEIGMQNQTTHMWGYASLDDRAARRAALAKEPEWQAFLKRAIPLIVSQETKILTPTPFSPIGGAS